MEKILKKIGCYFILSFMSAACFTATLYASLPYVAMNLNRHNTQSEEQDRVRLQIGAEHFCFNTRSMVRNFFLPPPKSSHIKKSNEREGAIESKEASARVLHLCTRRGRPWLAL
jgi:hypothetical protein